MTAPGRSVIDLGAVASSERAPTQASFIALRAAIAAIVLSACQKDPAPEAARHEPAKANAAAESLPPAASAAAPSRPPLTVVPFTDKEPLAVRDATPVVGCAIDRVGASIAGPQSTVGRAGPTHVLGWAADVGHKTVGPVVILELRGSGRFFAPAVRGVARPDVAAAMKAPELTDAGWEVLVDFSAVPAGSYEARLLSVSQAGVPEVCDPRHSVSVQ